MTLQETQIKIAVLSAEGNLLKKITDCKNAGSPEKVIDAIIGVMVSESDRVTKETVELNKLMLSEIGGN